MGWDPDKYTEFESQRTRPASDLVSRISGLSPSTAIDVGCGPGNSTRVLKNAFPGAEVLGIDSSPEMVGKASEANPDISFKMCDAREIQGRYDLMFSNACLQWIPDHRTLIPELMRHLNDGGTLAIQIPMNDEPALRNLREIGEMDCWDYSTGNVPARPRVLTVPEYYAILCGCTDGFDIWETRYVHALPSHQHVVEWVRGTALRPYLDALDGESARRFETLLLDSIRRDYPVAPDGKVLLGFNRLFFVARRG